MSIEESVYTSTKKRTLETMKKCSRDGNKTCHKHLGCKHPPLLNLEPDHIVIDELHLLLQVMDRWDTQKKSRGRTTNHVLELEGAIKSCGITFRIWRPRDTNGAPQVGQWDWTALNGSDKWKLLKELPSKFDGFFPELFAADMQTLWKVSSMSKILINPTQEKIDWFHEKV